MNKFDVLSAEQVEDRLATMTSEELPEIFVPQDCEIRCDDVGDEDCRKLNFNVYVGNVCVYGGHRTRSDAVGWAQSQGYHVTLVE